MVGSPSRLSQSVLPGALVLVVDDDPVTLEIARVSLEGRGFQVETTTNPIGFNLALTKSRPQVALVDVMMPALRGDILLEIASRYRSSDAAEGAPCRMYLHSSLPEETLREMTARCGADDFLRKGDPLQLGARLAEKLRMPPSPSPPRPEPAWKGTK